jgi:hypothetical protein
MGGTRFCLGIAGRKARPDITASGRCGFPFVMARPETNCSSVTSDLRPRSSPNRPGRRLRSGHSPVAAVRRGWVDLGLSGSGSAAPLADLRLRLDLAGSGVSGSAIGVIEQTFVNPTILGEYRPNHVDMAEALFGKQFPDSLPSACV